MATEAELKAIRNKMAKNAKNCAKVVGLVQRRMHSGASLSSEEFGELLTKSKSYQKLHASFLKKASKASKEIETKKPKKKKTKINKRKRR